MYVYLLLLLWPAVGYAATLTADAPHYMLWTAAVRGDPHGVLCGVGLWCVCVYSRQMRHIKQGRGGCAAIPQFCHVHSRSRQLETFEPLATKLPALGTYRYHHTG